MRVLPIALLFAASAAVSAAAVVINEDGGCTGFVPNYETETGLPELAILFGSTHSVVNSGGNTKLTCKFDHEVELERATGGQGFLCATPGGLTDDTMMVASPGGKATLVCQIKKPK